MHAGLLPKTFFSAWPGSQQQHGSSNSSNRRLGSMNRSGTHSVSSIQVVQLLEAGCALQASSHAVAGVVEEGTQRPRRSTSCTNSSSSDTHSFLSVSAGISTGNANLAAEDGGSAAAASSSTCGVTGDISGSTYPRDGAMGFSKGFPRRGRLLLDRFLGLPMPGSSAAPSFSSSSSPAQSCW